MTPAITEHWRIDRRYYYCRHIEQHGPDDRRVFLAVDDGFGNLVEVNY